MKKIIFLFLISLLFIQNIYSADPKAKRIRFTPAGTIEATNVQAAIEEVANEASGAPTDATYITQTANGTLTNEQALEDLDAGLLKSDGAGIISKAISGTDYIDTETDPNALLTAGTDNVKDTHVDWGTGASQISAVDLPIADAGNKITATEVEGALQENRTAIDLNTAADLDTVSDRGATTNQSLTTGGIIVGDGQTVGAATNKWTFDDTNGDISTTGKVGIGLNNPPDELSVLGNVQIQSATDSTTGVQILDANGGTPIFNVDTTNERVGIGTAAPGAPFQLGITGATGNVRWVNNGSNSYFGLYDDNNNLYYGISALLPAPSGAATLGGYYKGLGIGGRASGTTDPIFGVLNSAQSANGIGHVAFTIYANNNVVTYNNTLDTGSGGANFAGNVGIGTTTPDTNLDVEGSTGISIGEDKTGGTSNDEGILKFWSDGDNAFYSQFKTGVQTETTPYTLPLALPASNGLFQSTSGGVMSFIIDSAGLAGALSDETGSGGGFVRATSPTLTTPEIGAATATTPAADDNDTSVATTAYVQGEINGAGGRSITCSSGSCAADAETYVAKHSIAFEDPVATDDFFFGEVAKASTWTSIYCKTLVGTCTLDIQIAGTDINGTDITCNTTGVLDESLGGDTAGAVGEEVKLAITSVASAPTYLMVILNGTYND